MNHRVARLATGLLLAVAVRAALAQPAPPTLGPARAPGGAAAPDPYLSPQPQAPVGLPGAVPAAYGAPAPAGPAAGGALRYPLASGGVALSPGSAGPPPGGLAPAAVSGGAAAAAAMPRPAAGVSPGANGAAGPPNPAALAPWDIVAQVGDKYIFYGDVAPTVNQVLADVLMKAKSDEERRQIEQQLDAARLAMTRSLVRQLVDIKLKYLAFERELEKNIAERAKREEARRKIDQDIREKFEKDLQETRTKIAQATPEELQEMSQRDPILPRLAILMRDRQLESPGELDTVLRSFGSSLERQVRLFGEDRLGRQMVGKNITFNPEITHQEMLDYYYEHAADYAVPAKARFELLSVKFTNHPDRRAALHKIAAMGDAVYLGGKKFDAVAREQSEEPHAQEGGQYGWIAQGSLASEPIDRAVFSIEVGKLSQIIEDETGYHIVRVIERRPAGQVSFLEAQEEIKKAITQQKRIADYKKYVESLYARTEVWTVFDSPAVAQQTGGTLQR